MRFLDLVIVVIGPVLTAVIAGLGVLINEWRTQRRWETRQRMILERGLQEVTFIAQWSQAHSSLAADDPHREARVARAITDLERTYRFVEESLRLGRAERPDRWDVLSFARSLLLRGVRRPWARLVRGFYYLGILWAVFASVVMLATDYDSDYGWGVRILIAAVLTAAYSLPVWGLHQLARWLDRDRDAAAQSPAPTHG